MPKTTKKFYAVARGRQTGVYTSWSECEAQVKGFTNSRFKGFKTRSEAQQFLDGKPTNVVAHQGSRSFVKTKDPPAKKINARPTGSEYGLFVVVHFDGGSRGNPGLAGSGAQVFVRDRRMSKGSESGNEHVRTIQIRKYLGTSATNNVAEYQGLICGLKHTQLIVEEFLDSVSSGDEALTLQVHVQVYGDSDLLIKQLNGKYRCKHKNLLPLYEQAKSIVSELESKANATVLFEHVYRADNKAADGLANEAMDSRRSWTTTVEEPAESQTSASAKKMPRTSEV